MGSFLPRYLSEYGLMKLSRTVLGYCPGAPESGSHISCRISGGTFDNNLVSLFCKNQYICLFSIILTVQKWVI